MYVAVCESWGPAIYGSCGGVGWGVVGRGGAPHLQEAEDDEFEKGDHGEGIEEHLKRSYQASDWQSSMLCS